MPAPQTAATDRTAAAAQAAVPPQPSVQPLDSQQLLRGQNVVAITHNGALYRLQTTRQGKLILTK